jgi:hypothetical protein
MRWRIWLPLLAAAMVCLAAPQAALRGKLTQPPGKKPALAAPAGKLIALDGDRETVGVLNDQRLAGEDLEITGHFTAPDQFLIDPYTSRDAVYLHKNGKKYTISYWCPVCSIRTYTPGQCACCQQDTHLDLQEVQP